jgi:formate hydrogenlyase subunit 6/NADH:ubiquinone oxidoreductase subunit I
MSEKISKIGRRTFLAASAAAVAAPLVTGAVPARAADKPAPAKAQAAATPKGTKIYFIGHGCVGCHTCMALCPAKAVHFGNTGNEIDQQKCIHCGVCAENCPISMISESLS